MAIASCTRRNSGDSTSVQKSEQGSVIESIEEWDVVLTEPASSAYVRLNAPFPSEGSPHPDDQTLRATGEPSIENVDGSPILFRVRIVYRHNQSSEGGLPTPENKGEPPTRDREPYVYRWSPVSTTEPIDQDANGNPIATINGEQFDPPLTKEFYDAVFEESFNAAQVNENQYAENVGKVNSQPWKGYSSGRAKFIDYSLERYRDEQGNIHWRIMHRVAVRKVPPNQAPDKVWQKRIRAEGYLARENAGDEPKHWELNGEKTPVPVLHDKASGTYIADPNNAQWYVFDTEQEFDFSTLNIG